ncbi:hypothetical protein ATE84_4927 [Aquimarina sp. MAR_2010_214]|uniref:DUF6515 family protein n=1 Tax=Aquimarina sp. MAR_2010_214 TaxID=1250026 RepID=UPI000C7072CC|nr:DUF6515 family protein [Aquimarina sp. MAR_2010_214]PKV52800.1 hypothetical protein ATE84_4927 [Aquimarina sp. MAR_2010_214]
MKNVMRIVVPVVLFGFLMTSCATTVKVRPARGVVVTKVHRPKVVVHKNVHYYRSDGVWYVKKNRAYKRVTVPTGVRVTTLPRGYKTVKVRGVKYYRCKGVYYKKSGRKYIVVQV